jgi:hypothetical protein
MPQPFIENFQLKFCMYFLFTPDNYVLCLVHSSWFKDSNNMGQNTQIIKLIIIIIIILLCQIFIASIPHHPVIFTKEQEEKGAFHCCTHTFQTCCLWFCICHLSPRSFTADTVQIYIADKVNSCRGTNYFYFHFIKHTSHQKCLK